MNGSARIQEASVASEKRVTMYGNHDKTGAQRIHVYRQSTEISTLLMSDDVTTPTEDPSYLPIRSNTMRCDATRREEGSGRWNFRSAVVPRTRTVSAALTRWMGDAAAAAAALTLS